MKKTPKKKSAKKAAVKKAAEVKAAIKKCLICTRPARKGSNYCTAHPPAVRHVRAYAKKAAKKK